jgi:hypothetical protein
VHFSAVRLLGRILSQQLFGQKSCLRLACVEFLCANIVLLEQIICEKSKTELGKCAFFGVKERKTFLALSESRVVSKVTSDRKTLQI